MMISNHRDTLFNNSKSNKSFNMYKILKKTYQNIENKKIFNGISSVVTKHIDIF